MKDGILLTGTWETSETGVDLGASLSEQLGCFSVVVTGVATAVTAIITSVISVISITHWILNMI